MPPLSNMTLRSAVRRLLLPLVTWKVLLIVFALFSRSVLPAMFNEEFYRTAFISPAASQGRARFLETWDAQHYLHLSVYGYNRSLHPQGTAFWPLWPGCIATLRMIGLSPLVSAMILANVFSLCAFILFYTMVQADLGDRTADLALASQIAFPTAFYFLLPYSESLFYLLVVALFFYLQRGRIVLASATAVLLPLTRALGAFLVVPLFFRAVARRDKRDLLPVAGVVVGLVTYFAVMSVASGSPFAAFQSQRHFAAHASFAYVLNLPRFFAALVARAPLFAHVGSLVDRGFFLLYVALLPLVWKQNKTHFWCALVLGLIPAMTQTFASFSRYMLVIFPIFAAAGGVLERVRPSWKFLALGFALVVQVILFILHINNEWVA